MTSNELKHVIDKILQQHSRSSRRLDALADVIVKELKKSGLGHLPIHGGKLGEAKVPGFAREKNWDVAVFLPDNLEEGPPKPRLLVSLKSIMRNPTGTVPNRLDDLIGEVSSVQMLFPEVVIGYVAILDYGAVTKRGKASNVPFSSPDGMSHSEIYSKFKSSVYHLAIRKPPLWAQGLIESAWIIEIDTRKANPLMNEKQTVIEGERFITELVSALRHREPLLFTPYH